MVEQPREREVVKKNNVTLLVQGDFQAAKQPITTFITGSFLFGTEIGGFPLKIFPCSTAGGE